MAGIKLTHPLVLVAGVAVLVGGFVAWRELGDSRSASSAVTAPAVDATIPPAPPTATQADLAALAAIERRWHDTLEVASRTPRIGLAPVVTDLQAQRREAEVAVLGECLDRLKPALATRMRLEIDGYLDFMEGDNGNFSEKVAMRERAEARHMDAMVERGAMAAVVETCDPTGAAAQP